MFRSIAAAFLAASCSSAFAQFAWLDQEAHRPYQRLPIGNGSTPSGYTPQQMWHAYGLDQIANQGAGQIIGIVDGYDYPSVESDLGVFDTTFNLPACTKTNGCLTVVYAAGTKPPNNIGWSGETSSTCSGLTPSLPKPKSCSSKLPTAASNPCSRLFQWPCSTAPQSSI